jgi:hypothetical protein
MASTEISLSPQACEQEQIVSEKRLPCPSPTCDAVPAADDRYCDACGTWLGVDGEEPPTTGPLGRALRSTGALRIVSIIERAEASLNDMCK